MGLTTAQLDQWFMEEVLPLELPLARFLRRNWRDEAEVPDMRQEVFARVYEAGRKAVPQQTKAFVFMTARNLLIDKARRSRIVSMQQIADFEDLFVATDEPSAEEQVSSREELVALQAAIEKLPPKCREVLTMRKIQGLSQREVAEALNLSQSTVEKQVCKGVRRVADELYGENGSFANTRFLKAGTVKNRTHEQRRAKSRRNSGALADEV